MLRVGLDANDAQFHASVDKEENLEAGCENAWKPDRSGSHQQKDFRGNSLVKSDVQVRCSSSKDAGDGRYQVVDKALALGYAVMG